MKNWNYCNDCSEQNKNNKKMGKNILFENCEVLIIGMHLNAMHINTPRIWFV